MKAERLTKKNLLTLAKQSGGQAKTSGCIVMPDGTEFWPGDVIVWAVSDGGD